MKSHTLQGLDHFALFLSNKNQKQAKQKEKLQSSNKRHNHTTTITPEAKKTCQSPYPISPQLEQRKRQMQAQLLKTSPQNTPKATRPVLDPRNRKKDPTKKIRQKQIPTPRPTSRISWTDQEGTEEGRESRDLENR
ncbi:MAG: hypothetical protein EZS28_053114, partial [Streblomastix strix]